MKQSKRILAVLLALVMGLALFAPGVSAAVRIEEKKIPPSLGMFNGETLKLEIDVKVFDGDDELEPEYVWYDYSYDPEEGELAAPIATGAKLDIPITIQMVQMGATHRFYSVAVIADGECVSVYTSKVYMVVSVRHLPELYWNLMLGIAEGDTSMAGLITALMSPVMLVAFVFLTPVILFARLMRPYLDKNIDRS